MVRTSLLVFVIERFGRARVATEPRPESDDRFLSFEARFAHVRRSMRETMARHRALVKHFWATFAIVPATHRRKAAQTRHVLTDRI
ncbi:hypothetical protein [Pedococcus sp. 2YAF34]|uniref:hypothetical protein n=1 Tax=Pedococcus sp. 2YAF34 TaxID=3233032 RepID=UPI003F9D25D7